MNRNRIIRTKLFGRHFGLGWRCFAIGDSWYYHTEDFWGFRIGSLLVFTSRFIEYGPVE